MKPDIRPVSDLRNHFTEIADRVEEGHPVYLTKNGYGSMVVMSIDEYSKLTDPVEYALDQADHLAETTTERLSHEEVFSDVRKLIHE